MMERAMEREWMEGGGWREHCREMDGDSTGERMDGESDVERVMERVM
jgi:hypothetical protein